MEPGPRRFGVRDYLRILTKRKWFIFMVALAATILGGLYARSWPKTYRAATTVLVHRQTKPTVWIGDRAATAPSQPVDVALETQARIAASTGCAERAALALKSRTTGDRIEVDANEIAHAIVATTHEPDLIRIEATHSKEEYAKEFANEVATAFRDISRESRQGESRAAKDFLIGAEAKADKKLREAQAAAARYQETIGIVAPKAESELHVSQLYGYRDAARKAEADLAAARADLAVIRGQRRGVTAYTKNRYQTQNPARELLTKQIEAEQTALTQLRARYTSNWPAVREAQRRIEGLQAQLARTPEMTPTTDVQPEPRYRVLAEAEAVAERRVAEASSQAATLRRTVRQLDTASRTMPAELDRLQRLLDRAEMAKTAYQNILAQLETAKLNEAVKQADVDIIDRALRAEDMSPRMGRMLVFSFMLGIAFGIALAMLLEALDDTFHTPDDISVYTDVPFLGIVPMLEEPGQGLVTIVAPKSPPAEAYRTLRSNIHFAQLDNPARAFLVTSAGAGEGKTLTTANLAVAFAQAGQEVLLIDTDLRRPSLHRLFNLSSEQGLTNVLMGEAELDAVAQETEVPGLRVITTGPLPPNPAELIESRQMNAVIERSREIAEVVFYDSPPAIILTDAVILSSKVERTILVAEAGQVSRDAFNEMCRMIRNARGDILGVVLNKLRLSASDYYYYYYYYDYSHYAPRRGAPGEGAPSLGGNQGLVRPEAPTVLETLFGEEAPAAAPVQPPVDEPPPGDDELLLPSDKPPTGPAAAPPRPSGPAPHTPPGAKRWRFNGRGFEADSARRGGPQPPAPDAPPPAEGPQAPREPNPLDELFGEGDDKP